MGTVSSYRTPAEISETELRGFLEAMNPELVEILKKK